MKIIMASRSAGKTYQCVHALKNNPLAVLIVPLQTQKDSILQQYKYKGLKDRIFSCVELTPGKFNGTKFIDAVIIIDNLEAVLRSIFGKSVVLATFSIEDRLSDSVFCSMEG